MNSLDATVLLSDVRDDSICKIKLELNKNTTVTGKFINVHIKKVLAHHIVVILYKCEAHCVL